MATECQTWRHTPSISALRVRVGVREAEAGRWIPEFKPCLVYSAGATQRSRNGFMNFLVHIFWVRDIRHTAK